jgi:hypothetical protein
MARYAGTLSKSGNNIIFAAVCGVVVSQISTAGTAAQTMIVRIISQTAVIFSTIDPILLNWLYKSSNRG